MRTLAISVLFLPVFLFSACAPAYDKAADEQALRALDADYVAGWKLDGMAAQEAAIMALMDKDAVIMPGLGTDPRRGDAAIRDFWFPDGGPPTVTTEFVHEARDIDIDGDLGVISGRYTLRFDYDGKAYAQEGNYLTVAERQDDGAWLISRIIWNDREIGD